MSRVEESPGHMSAHAGKATPTKSERVKAAAPRTAKADKTPSIKASSAKSPAKKAAARKSTSTRGFASMDSEKQRAIASKGGQSVPDEKRSFSRNRQLAAEAGRKGGRSVPDEKRSFSRDPALAAEAGRKGGQSPSRTE